MADFAHPYWGWFIGLTTLASLTLLLIFVAMVSRQKPSDEAAHEVWDQDLSEANNPLPRWWLGLFYLTLVFGAGYLIAYPGLGMFDGVLGWTQIGQYQRELEQAERTYAPVYDRYRGEDIAALARDPEALAIGRRLYAAYCTGCHGADAGGGRGFPNLRDHDWLYGGDPEAIEASIRDGRAGVMPAWQPSLGDAAVAELSRYVLGLSGAREAAVETLEGKALFETNCAICHGAGGDGNVALGAPKLSDDIWLYGGSSGEVTESIARGRQNNVMPAHGERLGEAKLHLLAAYVYSLSASTREP